ncbi:hypothetical protein QOT17_019018 [Balamuthia mandrillaris]
MRIAVVAAGSCGDVQPALAFGLGLQRLGHKVVVLCHPQFKRLVLRHGLGWRPLGGSGALEGGGGTPPPLLFAWTAEGQGLLAKGEWEEFRRQRDLYLREEWPQLTRQLDQVCKSAEIIVSTHALLDAAYCLAEKYALPLVPLYSLPYTPTEEFASPFSFRLASASSTVPSSSLLPSSLFNKWSHYRQQLREEGARRDLLNRWREEGLGLAPFKSKFFGVNTIVFLQRLLVISALSPRLLPRPKDWPRWDIKMHGFLRLPSSSPYTSSYSGASSSSPASSLDGSSERKEEGALHKRAPRTGHFSETSHGGKRLQGTAERSLWAPPPASFEEAEEEGLFTEEEVATEKQERQDRDKVAAFLQSINRDSSTKKREVIILLALGGMPFAGRTDYNIANFLQALRKELVREHDKHLHFIVTLGQHYRRHDPLLLEKELQDAGGRWCVLVSVPQDEVFPFCDCVVHHGGRSTTVEGIRGGVPMVICGSQPENLFWGEWVVGRLGLGPRHPLSFSRLTPSTLSKAVQDALRLKQQSENNKDSSLVRCKNILLEEEKNSVGAAVTALERVYISSTGTPPLPEAAAASDLVLLCMAATSWKDAAFFFLLFFCCCFAPPTLSVSTPCDQEEEDSGAAVVVVDTLEECEAYLGSSVACLDGPYALQAALQQPIYSCVYLPGPEYHPNASAGTDNAEVVQPVRIFGAALDGTRILVGIKDGDESCNASHNFNFLIFYGGAKLKDLIFVDECSDEHNLLRAMGEAQLHLDQCSFIGASAGSNPPLTNRQTFVFVGPYNASLAIKDTKFNGGGIAVHAQVIGQIEWLSINTCTFIDNAVRDIWIHTIDGENGGCGGSCTVSRCLFQDTGGISLEIANMNSVASRVSVVDNLFYGAGEEALVLKSQHSDPFSLDASTFNYFAVKRCHIEGAASYGLRLGEWWEPFVLENNNLFGNNGASGNNTSSGSTQQFQLSLRGLGSIGVLPNYFGEGTSLDVISYSVLFRTRLGSPLKVTTEPPSERGLAATSGQPAALDGLLLTSSSETDSFNVVRTSDTSLPYAVPFFPRRCTPYYHIHRILDNIEGNPSLTLEMEYAQVEQGVDIAECVKWVETPLQRPILWYATTDPDTYTISTDNGWKPLLIASERNTTSRHLTFHLRNQSSSFIHALSDNGVVITVFLLSSSSSVLVQDNEASISTSYIEQTPNHQIIPKNKCGDLLYGFSVLAEFTSIQELNQGRQVVKQMLFPKTSSSYSYFRVNKTSGTVDVGLNSSSSSSSSSSSPQEEEDKGGANYEWRFNLLKRGTSVTVQDYTFDIDQDSNKWSIGISGWRFLNSQNHTHLLRLNVRILSSDGPFLSRKDGEGVETFAGSFAQHHHHFVLTTKHTTVTIGVLNFAFVDDDEDAKPVELVLSEDDLSLLSFVFPSFSHELRYDPNFGVIIDPRPDWSQEDGEEEDGFFFDEEEGCFLSPNGGVENGGGDDVLLYVVIPVSVGVVVVVAIAVVSAVVLISRKRTNFKQEVV